ncbi:AAA domain containing protein, putative [Angomonas deanei]|uniref:AAA domain containing protein, putative n=1 Tax=Angomonas deanei TaxID=59799 RepID=A0A7G2CTI8_9TRYP|nr:AAA domain containing protein, putative [Angomonas deanei]
MPNLAANFSAGDVVLVLLPLATFLPSLLKHLSATTHCSIKQLEKKLPAAWKALGCYPHVACVEEADKYNLFLKLSRNTAATCAPSAKNPFSDANIVEFLQHFNSADTPLYVKWLSSFNSTVNTLKALEEIHCTRFGPTILDPTTTARDNAAFHDAVENYLTKERTASVRQRVLQGDTLNDGQLRTVAAVLYAVEPSWDRGTPDSFVMFETEPTVGALGRISSPPLLIVDGPPGTGKTQTIASLVLNTRLHNPWAKVLICAPSNCAVDEALLRVKQLQKKLKEGNGCEHMEPSLKDREDAVTGASVLRVGVENKVSPDVLSLSPSVYLDYIVPPEMKDGKRFTRQKERGEVIKSAAVVCTTLGSLNQVSRHVSKFDLVIVDESSQTTEPEILQALMVSGKTCVLVGDPRQLQSTVLCQQAADHGLKRSLLTRLLHGGYHSLHLTVQHRMHPDCVAFSNAYTYDGKLMNARVVEERHLCPPGLKEKEKSIAQKLSTLPRFGFVNVRSTMSPVANSPSSVNRDEAKALVNHVRQLKEYLQLSVKEYGKNVGIITFYKAQKDLLFSMLTKEEKEYVEVATVDSFQGREKPIIFISCVRAPSAGQCEELQRMMRARMYRTDDSEDEDTVVDLPTEEQRRRRFNDFEYEKHLMVTGNAAEEPGIKRTRMVRQTLGFVSDWRRINVALTRAQDMCLVYGNGELYEFVADSLRGRQYDRHARQAMTTVDSTEKEILQALRAADEDPLLLGTLIQHAKFSMRHCALKVPRNSPCWPADSEAKGVGRLHG